MPESRLKAKLKEGPLVVAEGMVFKLERLGLLQAGAFVPEVVVEDPDHVTRAHLDFFRGGAMVSIALTYYANEDKLATVGLAGRFESINREALEIAKKAAALARDEWAAGFGLDPLVAGNVCNTFEYEKRDRDDYIRSVLPGVRKQVRWAAEAGVDFVIGETYSSYGEASLALKAIKEQGLDAVITLSALSERVSDDPSLTIEEACVRLVDEGADVVGLNCTRGPDTMLPLLKRIRERLPDSPLAALPVAFATTEAEPTFQLLHAGDTYPINLDHDTCTRDEIASFTQQARDIGVSYIGVCCGAEVHHIRAMAETLGRSVPASKYSPDIALHGALGEAERIGAKSEQFIAQWKGTDRILPNMQSMLPQAVRQAYEEIAPTYLRTVEKAGYVVPREMAQAFRKVFGDLDLPLDSNVIDAGCGTGISGAALIEAGFSNVHGLDFAPGLRAQIPEGLFQPFHDEGVIDADLVHLPERYWAQFDHVFAAGVVNHTPTKDLEGVVKLARPGGIVAFSVRESDLPDYQKAIDALTDEEVWHSVSPRFVVSDKEQRSSPHVVMMYQLLEDPSQVFGRQSDHPKQSVASHFYLTRMRPH